MKRFNLCLLLVAVISMIACSPEPEVKPGVKPGEETTPASPELKLSISSMQFASGSGSNVVSVISNQSWTASADADWVTVSPLTGTGSANVTISVTENEAFDSRTATVKIGSDKVNASLSVTQKGIDAVLKVINSQVDVPEEGGTFMVDVEYNVDFEVSVDESAADWISFVETKAVSSGKLIFSVAANESIETRTGNVTVVDKSGKAGDKVITFSQKAFTPILDADTDKLDITYEGGTFMIGIQYNVDFDVTVEESAAEWLTFVETKAASSGNMIFEASRNDSTEERTGHVTLSDKSGRGSDRVITICQAGMSGLDKDREALMTIYAEMGGNDTWTNWGSDTPVDYWSGVRVEDDRVKGFRIGGQYGVPATFLKDCIAGLTELDYLEFEGEEVTGTIPEGLSKLTNLEQIQAYKTSLSGDLPDIFGEMKKLRTIQFVENRGLTGTLPESLGQLPELKRIAFTYCSLTGSVPGSWFQRDIEVALSGNHLSGKMPDELFKSDNYRQYFYNIVFQRDADDQTVSLDLTDVPFVPVMIDSGKYVTVDGNSVVMDEVIAQNKYTIRVDWGVSNPYAEDIMDQVKALYERYHVQGLEVIAINTWDPDVTTNELKEYITKHGYDKWINIDVSSSEIGWYPMVNPAAEVYDQDGHLRFTFQQLNAASTKGSQTAVYDLLPFIRTLFGDFDPDYVSTDFSRDGEVVVLQQATVGNGINLVLMGDAYVDKDMEPGGHYETMMEYVMEEFFSVEPYKSFRDRFNVYVVKAVSKNSTIGEGMETALKVEQGYGREVVGNVDICMEYALKVPSITSRENLTVITMVNNLSTGATTSGLFGYNSGVSFISTYNDVPSIFSDIVIHEAGGHAFAHLADEYIEFGGSPEQSIIDRMKTQSDEKGWWANVDFTNDPLKIKWSHFLTDDRYKDSVGIFLGGSTYEEGVWRPSEDSWMNAYEPYFNAPSREAIFKRIMLLSGEDYSFEKFAAYDVINR